MVAEWEQNSLQIMHAHYQKDMIFYFTDSAGNVFMHLPADSLVIVIFNKFLQFFNVTNTIQIILNVFVNWKLICIHRQA